MKVSLKKFSLVVCGSVLFCANMQGATLKEIEAQKKAEEAKAEKQLDNLGKGELAVFEPNDTYILTKIKEDIPAQKKELLLKAIYFINVAQHYKPKMQGHIIDEKLNIVGHCRYIHEYGYKQGVEEGKRSGVVASQDDEVGREYVRRQGYFSGEYGFADTCLLNAVDMIAYEYQNVWDKKYLNEWARADFNQKEYNDKKAFVKWLHDIKFFDYINNLEVEKNSANQVLGILESIKEKISFKPYF